MIRIEVVVIAGGSSLGSYSTTCAILYMICNMRSNWSCLGNILDKCMDAMEREGKFMVLSHKSRFEAFH